MPRTLTLLPALGLLPLLALQSCAPEGASTPLEAAGGDALTSYSTMMEFFQELAGETGAFAMDTIGASEENRSLVVLRFSADPAGAPDSFDKLRILIFAQQHGDEPSGKEAAIALARDIATGAFTDFLESVDLFLVPQVNPDGSERRQRRNALDMDLNRDHLTLSTPEVRGLHGLYRQIRPDVTLDVHEYGMAGSAWREAGLYKDFGQQIGALSNPNMSLALRTYAWDEVIPGMREDLQERRVDLHRYLVTDGPGARFRYSTTALNDGRNSMGIYHSLSFLIEGRNGLSVESDIRERTRQQLETMKAFLRFFAKNAQEVRTLVRGAKNDLASGNLSPEVALVMDYVPDPAVPEITVGAIDIETGETRDLVIDAFHPKVEATLWIGRPAGYWIPDTLPGVREVLERHGIPVHTWESPRLAHLESYSIQSVSSTTKEDKDFLQVEVTTSSDTMTIPAGSSVVLVQGPASNLIVAMLEPQSQWGLAPLPDFVELLEEGSVYPIRRILDYRY